MQGGSAMSPDLLSPAQLESDAFMIFCYKIVPCAKKFGHDWSECPFAHNGEKATRRCPALYLYSSIVCPDVRQSMPCPQGDICPYSHSIFEYWMHPARFRVQMCSFGSNCTRRICFFAHAQDQLRVPNDPSVADALRARAPYLQGRVGPKSRYALYLEQAPTSTGMLRHALVGQDAAFPAQGIQQMVQMPAGNPAGGPVQYGTAGGPISGLQQAPILQQQQQQQQWGQGGSIMYIPGGSSAGALGGGYYRPARQTLAAGSLQPSMGQLHSSSAMVVPQAGLQLAAAAGNTYSCSQGSQLVVAVDSEGCIVQYPVAAADAPGAMMAYVQPTMYASAPLPLPSPMQQPWVMQEGQVQAVQQHMHSQQPSSQQLQLVQSVRRGDSLSQPGAHERLMLGQPPAPFRQGPSTGGGSYAVLPAGAPVVNIPGQALPPVGHSREAGSSGVDDLAQQICGWQIT